MKRQGSIRMSVHLPLATAACTLLAVGAIRAQQAPAQNGPLLPVAASSVVARPDDYVGQTVSVYATVESALSATTFAVDQHASQATLKTLFVVAPSLQTQPSPGSTVTVVGRVMRFDPAQLQRAARSYRLDVAPEVIARYQGQPMILATSVIDASLADLAKRPIIPPTPEEVAFSEVMKQINPSAAELRKGIAGTDVESVRTQAADLRRLFGETTAFFKARGTADAVAWATEAVGLAQSIEESAAAGRWPDAEAASAKLTPLCQSCHSAHRERQEDGSYRVK